MDITLAATWNPRGELARFLHLLGVMQAVYSHIVIVSPPDEVLSQSGIEEARAVQKLPGIEFEQVRKWTSGRYTALANGLKTASNHIQYADMDRLLRWVETRFEEWQQTVEQIARSDCLVIGRTPASYRTHPRSIIQTEAISNRVVSYFLGKPMDVSAGSKGFSQAAAEYLVANTAPFGALGTDAQWPIMLHKAGYRVDYVEVDGLDWESADRYLNRAANPLEQKRAAEHYDQNPENWEQRIDIALEIVDAAIGLAGAVDDQNRR